MTDSVLGISGPGWVLVASDSTCSRSIFVLKNDEDKTFKLDDNKIMACQGEDADRGQFCQYTQKNITLHTLRTGVKLSTQATASWVREELAYAIRHGPFMCNVLIGGLDKGNKSSLYFVDYLGNMQRVPFAAHGYGGMFVLGLFDKYWRKDMTLPEGLELLQRAVAEIQKRLLLNAPHFIIKVVTDKGVQTVFRPPPQSADPQTSTPYRQDNMYSPSSS
ncbi:20S proteasome subunit beta type 2 [Pelomyxa schiedti]|nr:20S proteasome subunit beta type 2 [Pelomyxa schiedti]